MVFQSLSQMNNVLIIAPEICDAMLRFDCLSCRTPICSYCTRRKVLYDWINHFGKSFYTVNLRRRESLKRDSNCGIASFDSIDVDNITVGGLGSDCVEAHAGECRGSIAYDHLSSTIATHNSSGDLDKDPNIVVRTMKRALKKV